MLAFMTIMALLAMSVAPSIQQQAQREREIEAIFRGEEVAEAIRLYVAAHKGAPPTSIDDLLQGNPVGVKKVQILRREAAIDPLSSTGTWKLVRINDPLMVDFKKMIVTYNGGRDPLTSDAVMRSFAGMLPAFTALLDLGSKEPAPGGEDSEETSSGPFVGVVSRSRRASVLAYYGIERHDQWVFTPLFR
jgi:type II secretory pathway pseudopilin PulG